MINITHSNIDLVDNLNLNKELQYIQCDICEGFHGNNSMCQLDFDSFYESEGDFLC